MTWQQSQETVTKLGIRNKYGSLKKYKITFTVKQPDGSNVKTDKNGGGDGWVYVLFPDTFQTYTKPRKYTWKATVEQYTIAKGEFKYKN